MKENLVKKLKKISNFIWSAKMMEHTDACDAETRYQFNIK